ncbi:hypothetical protein MKS88_004859 [Plasmodium brasilianum]|uniref:Uncharacterized protein n=2 Tax=Plasmodium (Plasmodium) TaxID=418103 RepID=A0A1D3TCI1_PLAMA|nr:conserved Plasmodium protein, unknown function [Plasmodium malariae]KAI4835646.1 hypothetical protein MKS88_004859 [Plasmodium brasilianum]SCP02575.1 conserved Plasmodium protein, unknown function [Plasmodium malariae]
MNTSSFLSIFLYVLDLIYTFHTEGKEHVSIIHKEEKRDIVPKSWLHLIKECVDLIKDVYNLKDTIVDENDLIIWSDGKRMDEKYFESKSFKRGAKMVYVFLSSNISGENCFTRENVYRKISDEIEKYKNAIKGHFQIYDKEYDEWASMKEILKLLIKSKDLRDLLVDIKTDEQVEMVRRKILELTQENKNYQIFADMLKDNKTIYNILNDMNEWKIFVMENLENIKKLIEPYYPHSNNTDL